MYDLEDRVLNLLMDRCYYVSRGCILYGPPGPRGPEQAWIEFDASAITVDGKTFFAVDINDGKNIEILLQKLEIFHRRNADLLLGLQNEGYPPDWDLTVLLFVPDNLIAHIQAALPADLAVEMYALEWLEEDEEEPSASMRDNVMPFASQKH